MILFLEELVSHPLPPRIYSSGSNLGVTCLLIVYIARFVHVLFFPLGRGAEYPPLHIPQPQMYHLGMWILLS